MTNRPPRKPISPTAALNKAAALCARSEQASGDIYAKLTGWGLTTEEADGVMKQLISENYLNDERYARAYCRDKMRFNGWGRIKVAFMLKSKGIGKSHIEAVLAEVQYNEPQTMTVRIELIDNVYTPNTDDVAELEKALFDGE